MGFCDSQIAVSFQMALEASENVCFVFCNVTQNLDGKLVLRMNKERRSIIKEGELWKSNQEYLRLRLTLHLIF